MLSTTGRTEVRIKAFLTFPAHIIEVFPAQGTLGNPYDGLGKSDNVGIINRAVFVLAIKSTALGNKLERMAGVI